MGRRNGGRSLHEILRRCLESCKSRYSTVDEIVNHLRANYPDYQRTKQQTLTRFVQEALESSKRGNKQLNRKPNTPILKPDGSEDNDEDEEEEKGRSASRKRRKKIDENEERLQKTESLHLQRLQRDRSRRLSTSSASTSSPSSSSESEESDGEDGTVSTSKDAIYEEKVEPAFDLMKTMLRASNSGTKIVKSNAEEKNVELEVTNNNKATKIDAMDGVGGNMKDDLEPKRQLRGSVSNGNGDVGVRGRVALDSKIWVGWRRCWRN